MIEVLRISSALVLLMEASRARTFDRGGEREETNTPVSTLLE